MKCTCTLHVCFILRIRKKRLKKQAGSTPASSKPAAAATPSAIFSFHFTSLLSLPFNSLHHFAPANDGSNANPRCGANRKVCCKIVVYFVVFTLACSQPRNQNQGPPTPSIPLLTCACAPSLFRATQRTLPVAHIIRGGVGCVGCVNGTGIPRIDSATPIHSAAPCCNNGHDRSPRRKP